MAKGRLAKPRRKLKGNKAVVLFPNGGNTNTALGEEFQQEQTTLNSGASGVGNAVIGGVGAINPAVGAIAGASKSVGGAIRKTDEFGVTEGEVGGSSDAPLTGFEEGDRRAAQAAIFNPSRGASFGVKQLQEGDTKEGLLNIINPIRGGVASNRALSEERDEFVAGKVDEQAVAQKELDRRELEDGRGNVNFFAKKGGLVPMKLANGGSITPLSSDVSQANGATHANGGVDVAPGVEVEGGEVLQEQGNNTRVFSDRLKTSNGNTFAEESEKIGREKGRLEADLNGSDRIKKNSAERRMEIIESKLTNLFSEQQAQNGNSTGEVDKFPNGGLAQTGRAGLAKFRNRNAARDFLAEEKEQERLANQPKETRAAFVETSVPKDQSNFIHDDSLTNDAQGNFVGVNTEGDLTKTADTTGTQVEPSKRQGTNGNNAINTAATIVPFAAAAFNEFQTANSPLVPKVSRLEAPKLKTDFNINPQLADIKTSERALSRGIDSSSSGSQAGRQAKQLARVKSLELSGDLKGQKENIETQLINKDRELATDVAKFNIDRSDSQKFNEFLREGDIQARRSANVAQLSNNIQVLARESNLKERDQKELNLIAERFKTSGVIDRRGLMQIIDANPQLKDDPTIQEMLNDKQAE